MRAIASNNALQPTRLPSLGYGKRSAELSRWAAGATCPTVRNVTTRKGSFR